MPYVPPWENINPSDFLQAAEAGARLGLSQRGVQDQERQQLIDNSIESQRMNQPSQRRVSNPDAALQAKYMAEQILQQQNQKKDQLAQQQQQNELAIAALKESKPSIVSSGGGVGTFDPTTGQWTQLQAPTPKTPPKEGETIDDKMKLEKYRGLVSARDIAIRAGNKPLAQQYQSVIDQMDNPPPVLSTDQQSALDRINQTWKAPGFDFGSPQAKALIQERTDIENGLGSGSPLNSPASSSGLPDAGIPAPATPQTDAPKVGTVVDGYKFLGGDPSDKNNWEQQ